MALGFAVGCLWMPSRDVVRWAWVRQKLSASPAQYPRGPRGTIVEVGSAFPNGRSSVARGSWQGKACCGSSRCETGESSEAVWVTAAKGEPEPMCRGSGW